MPHPLMEHEDDDEVLSEVAGAARRLAVFSLISAVFSLICVVFPFVSVFVVLAIKIIYRINLSKSYLIFMISQIDCARNVTVFQSWQHYPCYTSF